MMAARGLQDAPEQAVDVAVVGGGLSGLVAARLLVKAGKSVLVLEASDRTGGRVRTGYVAGAVCELGGEWVAPFQKEIHALLDEFGIETFPTYTTGKNTFIFDGEVHHYDGPVVPLPVEDIAELVAALAELDEMASHVPVAEPWKAPHAATLDTQTMAQWIDANVETAGAHAALNLIVGGPVCCPPRELSLLHYLFLIKSTGGMERFSGIKGGVLDSRLVGGTGLITDKLTAELGDRVLLNAPVRLIDQTGRRVRITSDAGVVSADRVIVAVPPGMAARIQYDPLLPPARDQLMQRSPMGWGAKVFAAYETPFWRDAGLNGFVSNPTPSAIVHGAFDNSPPSGSPGVLYGLIEGDAAREWAPRPAAERKRIVLEAFARFVGPQALEPIDYLEHDWAAQPWVRGGASIAFGPGAWTEFGEVLRAPIDRIHWAATETAVEQWGSMNGAITAAERAVNEVLG